MATYNTFKDLAAYLGIDSNNPTVANQQKVKDWMAQNPDYEAGPVTNNYLNAKPNLFDYNQAPQNVVEPDTSNLQVQVQVPGVDPNGLNQMTQSPNLGKFKDTEAVNRAMGAWSPIAPAAFAGGDRSGEAAGYRAGAAIQDKAAADYSKILQWNKQRATDNTLADKVAAAQASGKWKQNANALGAEGGASVVASQNEAVTPDIMAQKQYQSQQMNTATQNLAEVNARKVAAQNNRTKADMTDYNTQYNDSKDAYVTNLATANNAQSKNTTEKKEEPKAETESATPETTEKPNGKVEDNTQNEEQQAAAETNRQSQAMENATQEVSEQQELQDLADEINGIHNAVESMKRTSQDHSGELRDLKARYDEIKSRYDELASKSKNPPPQASTPDFSMFDPKLSEVPSSTKAPSSTKVSSSILSGVNQRF